MKIFKIYSTLDSEYYLKTLDSKHQANPPIFIHAKILINQPEKLPMQKTLSFLVTSS